MAKQQFSTLCRRKMKVFAGHSAKFIHNKTNLQLKKERNTKNKT